MTNKLRVEFFGSVLPHQSETLNTHLEAVLNSFDRACARLGLNLGTNDHFAERQYLANIVRKDLLRNSETVDGDISKLSSHYEHSSVFTGYQTVSFGVETIVDPSFNETPTETEQTIEPVEEPSVETINERYARLRAQGMKFDI